MSRYSPQKCAQCKQWFSPNAPNARFCSDNCRRNFHNARKKQRRNSAIRTNTHLCYTIDWLYDNLETHVALVKDLNHQIVNFKNQITTLKEQELILKETVQILEQRIRTHTSPDVNMRNRYDTSTNVGANDKSDSHDAKPDNSTRPAIRQLGKATFKHCPRLDVRAINLPCGKRNECWHGKKCEHVPPGTPKPSPVVNPYPKLVPRDMTIPDSYWREEE